MNLNKLGVARGVSPGVAMIARCNRAFFEAAVAAELRSNLFRDAAYQGQHKPYLYGFTHAGYPARVLVDATDLRGEEIFKTNFQKQMDRAAERIRWGVTGAMNECLRIPAGNYVMEGEITGYWAGKSPDDGVFEDPTVFPIGTLLGRQLEIRIRLGV